MEGQVAVVTGGSSGLGRAFAERLAAAGARVAVIARSHDRLDETVASIENAGGAAVALAADVTDAAAVADAFDQVRQRLGPVDVLVNNAGIAGPVAPLWETDAAEWWRAVEINLRGAFLCCHAVMADLIERRGGRILNVTSNAGVYRWPYLSAYAIAKAAVIKLTENLAVESKRHRVKVFSVNPGLLRAGMTDTLLTADVPPDHPVRIVADWFRHELDQQEVTLDEAAEFVLFVASGRADALSGRYLSIYDGVDALVEQASAIRRDDLYTLRLREPA